MRSFHNFAWKGRVDANAAVERFFVSNKKPTKCPLNYWENMI